MKMSATEDRKEADGHGQHPMGLSGLSAPRIGSLFSARLTSSWQVQGGRP